jgi:phosphoglycerate dehydrogenase-like enzyme
MYPVVFPHAAARRLAAELAGLRRHGLQVRVVAPGARRGLRAALADAVLLWRAPGGAPVTADLLAEAPRLRLVQALDSGAEAIDLAAARARGVAVCAAPGADAPAVAEMVLALTLACLRRLPALDRAARAAAAGWMSSAAEEEGPSFGELGGRPVGLVGYGPVPACLAPALKALGATVVYWRRHREPAADAAFVPLRELFETSDVVSLHLPPAPENERLVDAAALGLMQPGAVLVNTAHGGLVDEAALADALASRHLGAAGLDVFATEPVPRDHPLLALDNVVVSPGAAVGRPRRCGGRCGSRSRTRSGCATAGPCCTGSPETPGGPRRRTAAGYAAGAASHSFRFDQRRRYSRRPLAAIATALGRATSTTSFCPRVTPGSPSAAFAKKACRRHREALVAPAALGGAGRAPSAAAA